jgi:hypothetical protein
MPQPLSSLCRDELEETTRPYTHSQIDDMRKLVARSKEAGSGPIEPRVYKVNLERFAHFGDAGTPAGMISSRSATSEMVSGSCGAEVEGEAAPAQSLVRAPSKPLLEAGSVDDVLGAHGWGPPVEDSDTDGVPVARVGVLEWAPTLVYGAATPEPIDVDVEPPTAKLELPDCEALAAPIVGRAREASAEQDRGELEPASRRKWVFVAGGVLLLGLALGVLWIAGQREPERAIDVAEVAAPALPAVELAAPEPEVVEAQEILEEVLVDEIEFEPEPAAERDRKSVAHETKPCALTRDQAAKASIAGNWEQVVTLTGKRKCWSNADKVEHTRMRMTALFELGRSGECLKAGQASNHPKIVTLRKRCTLAQQ